MLLKSIITEKCFANWVKRDSARSMVSVVHWIWQTGLTEVSLYIYTHIKIYVCVCACVRTDPCVCVAQLMLAESFCAVNHDINSEIKVR